MLVFIHLLSAFPSLPTLCTKPRPPPTRSQTLPHILTHFSKPLYTKTSHLFAKIFIPDVGQQLKLFTFAHSGLKQLERQLGWTNFQSKAGFLNVMHCAELKYSCSERDRIPALAISPRLRHAVPGGRKPETSRTDPSGRSPIRLGAKFFVDKRLLLWLLIDKSFHSSLVFGQEYCKNCCHKLIFPQKWSISNPF